MPTSPGRKADAVPRPPGARSRADLLDPGCTACAGRAVPAEGADAARVFFVGEAPGPDEDRLLRPFVGRAGRVLRECIAESGFDAGDIWITNVVKRFPYEEVDGRRKIRRPSPSEIEACLPHLVREIEALRPRLLVALGRTAAEALLGRRVPALGEMRRQVVAPRAELAAAPVFITHHPSALFYGQLRGKREGFLQDLREANAVARRTWVPVPQS